MTQATAKQTSLPIRIVQGILNAIQECMVPVIPMIMAGGLIKVLVILLNLSLIHILPDGSAASSSDAVPDFSIFCCSSIAAATARSSICLLYTSRCV